MDKVFSAVIATRPYTLDLALYIFAIDMNVFTEHLSRRTTTFESFSFDCNTSAEDMLQLLAHANLFEHFRTPRSSRVLMFKFLAAPVKSLSFRPGKDT